MGNDIVIIAGLMCVFILTGALLPYVYDSFDEPNTINADVDGLYNDVSSESENVSSVNAVQILLSVISMFFWSFGALPFWVELIYIIMRIIFWITIARNIWVGGGA